MRIFSKEKYKETDRNSKRPNWMFKMESNRNQRIEFRDLQVSKVPRVSKS